MSEVNRLAVGLGRADAKMVPVAAVVLNESATRIRNDMRKSARGHARFPSFPSSVTHDIRGLSAEIGPDKNKRQGALGNILYFGTVHNGPVLPHPSTALAKERPLLEAALFKALKTGPEDAIEE